MKITFLSDRVGRFSFKKILLAFRYIIQIFLLGIFLITSVFAGQSAKKDLIINALKIDTPPLLDGLLDDVAWKSAAQ